MPLRFVLIAISLVAIAFPQTASLPPLKRQPTPEAVVKEHLAAINACDWTRLMAQFPPDVEIFSPDGELAQGRDAVAKMFAGVVKPFAQGGLCGLTFTVVHTQTVGQTLNVKWRADAPFLAKPYEGADAYETRNGLMQAQVTTFRRSDLDAK
ncbi:MAG TPA: nuclear transport factor 2 family protein [Bryobacteraceae bacterium]|nr:nuclear transport factor 2 family protein [Bryobacteraceae bacterium]